MSRKLAFIGIGNMASAIISGITSRNDDPILWSDLILYDLNTSQTDKFSNTGALIVHSVFDAVSNSDCVILCIKPQNFPDVLAEISSVPNVQDKLFITIAAGISTDVVSNSACGAPVVRVMPNTPMLIGCGVSAICKNDIASDDDFEFACRIFSSAGSVIRIREDEMNRIICVSGSSPAYVFMFIDAILNGAIAQGLVNTEDNCSGLSEKEMLDVICDTVIGSAKLMKYGNCSPQDQIQRVCSKGGTTERAVSELMERGIYEMISYAMKKCTDRANELSSIKNK